MRKILLCFIGMLVFSSCTVSISRPPPIGLWKSEHPNLTLSIESADDSGHRGIYVKDDIPYEVVVFVAPGHNEMSVFDTSVFDFTTQQTVTYLHNPLFIGGWKLKGGKLQLKLFDPITIGEKAVKTIVFEDISDKVSPEEIFGEILNEVSEEGDVQSERE